MTDGLTPEHERALLNDQIRRVVCTKYEDLPEDVREGIAERSNSLRLSLAGGVVDASGTLREVEFIEVQPGE